MDRAFWFGYSLVLAAVGAGVFAAIGIIQHNELALWSAGWCAGYLSAVLIAYKLN
jgi:hypothetical protein